MDSAADQANAAASAGSSGVKRKNSDAFSVDEPPKKIANTEAEKEEFNLLDFSDEILLEILLHCDCYALRSLYRLIRFGQRTHRACVLCIRFSPFLLHSTCRHFENLVKDRRLWTSFKLEAVKLPTKEIKKFVKCAGKETKEFAVRGMVSAYPREKYRNNTITKNILSQLSENCPALESVEVIEGFINFEKVSFTIYFAAPLGTYSLLIPDLHFRLPAVAEETHIQGVRSPDASPSQSV